MEHEGDNYTNPNRCFWYCHQRIIKGTGGLGGRSKTGDYPNNNIIKNCLNTEKSPVDLRKLPVTNTSVKNHNEKLI